MFGKEPSNDDVDISRRDFLKKMGLGMAAASLGVVVRGQENEVDNIYERVEINKPTPEEIESEKELLRVKIDEMISKCRIDAPFIRQANEVLRTLFKKSDLGRLTSGSPKENDKSKFSYSKDESEESRKVLEAHSLFVTIYRQGDGIIYLSEDAIDGAEQLLNNETALNNLSFISAFLKVNSIDFFRYNHNNALSYLQILENPTFNVPQRTQEYVKYFKNIKPYNPMIMQDDFFYFLQNENFDRNLNAEKLKENLRDESVQWEDTPANNQVDHYCSNNELDDDVYDLFELNRINDLAKKTKNPDFIKSVFDIRDYDLSNINSESGGFVPINGNWVTELAPSQNIDNFTYDYSRKSCLFNLQSLATCHFHSPFLDCHEHTGPSGGDAGRIFPAVVFTSLNENEIVGHFYVSRRNSENMLYRDMAVFSLGVIEKNH